MSKVWVVVRGSHDERDVVGIFARIEDVLKAFPVGAGKQVRRGGWKDDDGGGDWWNGLDWSDRLEATQMEIT